MKRSKIPEQKPEMMDEPLEFMTDIGISRLIEKLLRDEEFETMRYGSTFH